MHPHSDGKRRLSSAVLHALACLAVVVLWPALLCAAPPTGDRIFYINQKSFLIPATPEPGAVGIQRVLLHVSNDLGKTYKNIASSTTPDEKFKFTAPADGWYWFSVQTMDSAGRYFPPNVNAVLPGLKVCVDTLPPAIYLKQIPSTEFTAAFEWDIREEHPDLFSLKTTYHTVGSSDWIKLELPPRLAGQYGWNPPVKGPWEVRMQFGDKAGNVGEQTTTVTAAAWRPDATATAARGTLHRVNSKQFQLNYKVDLVGKSDISTVEIWKTEDDGRSWKPDIMNAPRPGPCTVKVTREGIFGFFVVPVSGVGLSDPPVAGTPPQVSVEVDTTPPVVSLLGPPLIGTGPDLNKVTIRYQAVDKNFGPTPIKIQWRDAKSPTSEWGEVASNLPNDGVYIWNVPDSIPAHSFIIRVEAVDLAGNVGFKETERPVNVDPIKPKASIIGVEAVKVAPPPP